MPVSTLPQPALSTGVAGTGPAFSAYASASQTITLGTATKVAIDTENFDTNSNFDTSTYRFTPTVAGYYQVNGSVRGNAATTFTQFYASIYKNGSEIIRAQFNGSFTNTANLSVPVTTIVYMNGTTDYLELYGLANGSGTATFGFTSSVATSQFSACLVRAA